MFWRYPPLSATNASISSACAVSSESSWRAVSCFSSRSTVADSVVCWLRAVARRFFASSSCCSTDPSMTFPARSRVCFSSS